MIFIVVLKKIRHRITDSQSRHRDYPAFRYGDRTRERGAENVAIAGIKFAFEGIAN
jgi:hypothetical protein